MCTCGGKLSKEQNLKMGALRGRFPRASGVAARATRGGEGDRALAPSVSRRRVVYVALGEAFLDIAGACACEIAGRPKYGTGDGVFGLVRSLLPQPISERFEEAKTLLSDGQRAMEATEYSEAARLFTRVLEVAPTEYKICQQARNARTEAYRKLGDSSRAGEDFRRQWLWGRGLRWPGHVILLYIFLRQAVVPPAPTDGDGGGSQQREQQERKKGGIPSEWFLVAALVVAYNVILFNNLH